MAGMPANIVLDPIDNAGAQQTAVMISANHTLNHNPPTNFICYTDTGHHFKRGNQAEGVNGPEAITDYVWDFGGNNSEVGHRRWILFPPTAVMGTGDVPPSGSDNTNAAANSTWVFDSSINNPRPATRQPYVAWPPEGFVPYQVVFPYWSFALSNADVSLASVTIRSNGVPVPLIIQPQTNGFGENTLVWVPMGLDASCECTAFPFNGTDTVYSVTVSNINNNNGVQGVTNLISVSYNVTVIDPAVPGADFVPPTVNGPAQMFINTSNTFNVTAINNPHVTSYEWITSQVVPGNISDDANNGLANFTFTPSPDYSVIASAPDGSENCFHLCDDNGTSQILQLNELLYPSANTTVSFASCLGISTSYESARVQVSTDGGTNWQDLFVEVGCNSGGQCETTFTPHTLSLSAFAGQQTLLRFDYQFLGGSFFPGQGQSGSEFGWCLENIVVTNTVELINQATNLVTTTNITSGNLADDAANGLVNFTFSPATDYLVTTNAAPDGSGFCFHLCDDDGTSQILQLNEVLLPNASTTVSFGSCLGISTSDESAHVQVSTDGGTNWQDLFAETGCNSGGQCENTFTPHTLSLASFAGQKTLLRFDYQFFGGSFYPGVGQSDPAFGWCLENIVISNAQQFAVSVVNTTNFTFTPTQPGIYFIQAVPVIFNQFPLDAGPVTAVTVSSSGIVMNQPVLEKTERLSGLHREQRFERHVQIASGKSTWFRMDHQYLRHAFDECSGNFLPLYNHQ